MASAAAYSVAGFEAAVVLSLRIALFYSAQKFLLRSLYHDLQGLSSDEDNSFGGPDDGPELELQMLPTPSTTPQKPHDTSIISITRTFHSTLSRAVFSLCFSECCTLFLLLMLQALDVLHPRTRLLNWNISLAILVALITVIIPLAYSLVLSYRSATSIQGLQRPTITRLFLTALPVGLFLFLLSFIPLPTGFTSTGTTSIVFARLTVVGTVILGLLSGFGAVNNAWRFFPVLSRTSRPAPTDDQITRAEDGLNRVRYDLAERRVAIAKLGETPQTSSSSWLANFVPTFVRRVQRTAEVGSAMQEIAGLEALESQMARNFEGLKQQREDAKFSRTLSGRMFNFGGCLFAVYCVYRIFIAIVNLAIPSRSRVPASTPDGVPSGEGPRTDFITVFLAYLVSLVPTVHLEHEDIALMSRQISLALVGIIILSSIRLVLRGVTRALRVTSRNLGTSLMLLIVAQLMGIYLLSTLVQLRTSFPPPLQTHPDTMPDIGVVNLFSTLPEYQVFGTVFDSSFLIAATLTAFVRWFSERIGGVGVVDS
ncbi:Abscisic acid G-protein coupled receptor-domain-containing protein [Irpex rosettiformis]|uniref:Abscisic acid G-protein coupled receptor-domain-containing protein n=1 Tax=Irpex rosettiformis TaxID=378272 RepID=A0ACB8TZI7_9APHY|nr:Abscisic acid G-protein coupled receptor-domain-containing protein [Irpex rosettiformis]